MERPWRDALASQQRAQIAARREIQSPPPQPSPPPPPQIFSVLPIGIVLPWDMPPGGYPQQAPAGWWYCDGSIVDVEDSPYYGEAWNYEGRFLMGADVTLGYPVGSTGGDSWLVINEHAPHGHEVILGGDFAESPTGTYVDVVPPGTVGSSEVILGHSGPGSQSVGVGNAERFPILPPFVATRFIKKIK